MKQLLAAITLAILTGCSTGQIATDVKVDSYQEEFKTDVVDTPVMTEVEEQSITAADAESAVPTDKTELQSNAETASVQPEIEFTGYTIQVAAFDDLNNFNNYVEALPTEQPVWKHTKMVDAKRWFAVLVGQFDSFEEAQVGAASVSAQLGISAPYIRSIDRIMRSSSPWVDQVK